jgi:hypothetical protein
LLGNELDGTKTNTPVFRVKNRLSGYISVAI